MNPNPLRLLLAGYAVSGAVAALLAPAAGGAAALLVFWLGGAAAVLALAVLPGVSRPFRAAPEDLEAEIERWEEDRWREAEAARRADAREDRPAG